LDLHRKAAVILNRDLYKNIFHLINLRANTLSQYVSAQEMRSGRSAIKGQLFSWNFRTRSWIISYSITL